MIPLWLQALVLGVVQGLSEFVPISSDGHLVLVPFLLGWEEPSLSFIVALHMGTLGAVLLYFRRELLAMLMAVTSRSHTPEAMLHRRLAMLLAAGSVPVAVVGLLLEARIEEAFTSPLIAAAGLLVTAALLIAGERARDRRVAAAAGDAGAPAAQAPGRPSSTATATEAQPRRLPVGRDGRDPTATEAQPRRLPVGRDGRDPTATEAQPRRLSVGRDERDATATEAQPRRLPLGRDGRDPTGGTLADLNLKDAVIIGTIQTIALLPGVSRSGSTITAGIFAGLTREAATRFSFLLSIPALVGAGLLNVTDLAEAGAYSAPEIAAGVLAAFLSGYAAIRWLVTLVARGRLTGFAWYCIAAAIIALLALTL